MKQSKREDEFAINSLNVMAFLVVEEVERQIRDLPSKIAKYIKPIEITAYALNRLPGLYATSQRGWQRQLNRGRIDFSEQITIAVRQAVIAVQRDLLCTDIPLCFDKDEERAALFALHKHQPYNNIGSEDQAQSFIDTGEWNRLNSSSNLTNFLARISISVSIKINKAEQILRLFSNSKTFFGEYVKINFYELVIPSLKRLKNCVDELRHNPQLAEEKSFEEVYSLLSQIIVETTKQIKFLNETVEDVTILAGYNTLLHVYHQLQIELDELANCLPLLTGR